MGSQFIVYKAGLDCSTLQVATVGNNTGNDMICSNTTTGNRALSANLVAGQRYYIAWDGGSGDECDYYWEITRAIPAPLPVELLSFNTECEKGGVKAEWSTATETNNDYFILERSQDGVYYSEIEKVKGAGNSSSIKNYSTYDHEPLNGTNYYRIKQVDFNGEFTYSKPSSVICKPNGLDVTAIVPVPSDNYVDVYFSTDKEEKVVFEVHDLLGNKVITENEKAREGGNMHRIDLTSVSGGMYYLTVKNSSDIFSGKLIKR